MITYTCLLCGQTKYNNAFFQIIELLKIIELMLTVVWWKFIVGKGVTSYLKSYTVGSGSFFKFNLCFFFKSPRTLPNHEQRTNIANALKVNKTRAITSPSKAEAVIQTMSYSTNNVIYGPFN